MPELILASGSPRRRELLAEAGYRFRVSSPSDGAEPDVLDGTELAKLPPEELVAELARRKGRDVAERELSVGGDALVLAADTVAECDARILGKPKDEADARAMLTWMSGREHRVLTGVCLIGSVDGPGVDEPEVVEVVETALRMAPLGDDWLEPYLASGRWAGKAGAFGYQDGLTFVDIVSGSESNVVGLPMERLAELLSSRGCFPADRGQS